MEGGFFLRKKPLECLLSVYSNSENAIVAPIEGREMPLPARLRAA
jgi:hypothetical protein